MTKRLRRPSPTFAPGNAEGGIRGRPPWRWSLPGQLKTPFCRPAFPV
jgi:hypothetical protein